MPSRRNNLELNPAEVRQFLDSRKTIIIVSNGLGGYPHPMPMWFHVDDAGVLGLINGLLITYVGLPPFIATYGTLWVLFGFAYLILQGAVIYGFPAGFRVIGNGHLFGIPMPIVVMTVVFLTGYFLLHHTTLGHRFFATGANLETARMSGIKVERVIIAEGDLEPFRRGRSLADAAAALLEQQNGAWDLLRKGYAILDTVQTRVFGFDDFTINLQFNPGRLTSSFDDAMDFLREKYDIVLPLGNLLRKGFYSEVKGKITSGQYVGRHRVGRTNCHHLAFTTDEVDWQVWVEDGPKPLPRKIVVTYKTLPESPQFSASIGEWQLSEQMPDKAFDLAIPADASRIEILGKGGDSDENEGTRHRSPLLRFVFRFLRRGTVPRRCPRCRWSGDLRGRGDRHHRRGKGRYSSCGGRHDSVVGSSDGKDPRPREPRNGRRRQAAPT